jgi:hypothetical protein
MERPRGAQLDAPLLVLALLAVVLVVVATDRAALLVLAPIAVVVALLVWALGRARSRPRSTS